MIISLEVEYCMSELVDMALGQRTESPSFDLIAKPLDSLDAHERPPLIVILVVPQHYAHLLATILFHLWTIH